MTAGQDCASQERMLVQYFACAACAAGITERNIACLIFALLSCTHVVWRTELRRSVVCSVICSHLLLISRQGGMGLTHTHTYTHMHAFSDCMQSVVLCRHKNHCTCSGAMPMHKLESKSAHTYTHVHNSHAQGCTPGGAHHRAHHNGR
jgi:hypothetical protein